MSGGQKETPARGQAQPGQDGRLAIAAGILKVAQKKNLRQALRLRMALASLIWGAA